MWLSAEKRSNAGASRKSSETSPLRMAALRLGARVLKAAGDVDSGENFQVYADPAGHPFCLCWVERREPRSV
jgi:hypothetical protein